MNYYMHVYNVFHILENKLKYIRRVNAFFQSLLPVDLSLPFSQFPQLDRKQKTQ